MGGDYEGWAAPYMVLDELGQFQTYDPLALLKEIAEKHVPEQ